MRILHLGKYFPPHAGGMEVYLSELIAEQRAQGVTATALVHGEPLPDDPQWLIRVPVQASIVFAPIAIGYRSALEEAIREFEPDALHLHMPNNSVFWALTLRRARGIPWFVHWHSDVVISSRLSVLRIAYFLYRPFEQAVLARARRIVATSPPYLSASEPLRAWTDKCTVIPLGLSPPTAVGDAELSPWADGVFRLLSIGRLTYYKGFETLIDVAFSMENVELLIVGEGDLRGALQSRIDRHVANGMPGRVRLMGAVSEWQKHALLESCDVFCLASRERTEAFGMVLLEAMSHARPCLVSALPGSGMSWLVAETLAGLTCQLNDIMSWNAAIRWMMANADERTAMGHRGRRAFLERFTMEKSASALTREYLLTLGVCRTPHDANDVLIVIPAKNESATIGALLLDLCKSGHKHVLVVDDLSEDNTGDIARTHGAMVLRPTLGMGAWGGMQTGIRYARRKGYRRVVTMDADGQHDAGELSVLLRSATCADVVIGAFPQRASKLRHLAWTWFRLLTGLRITDLTSGFRVYNEKAMEILASAEATLFDYQDVGTLLLLRRAGLTVVETPVVMNERLDGKSRIFSSWLNVGRYMAVTTLLCLARWRRPF